MAKASSLWDYYLQRGQQMPSVQERRQQFNLPPDYKGTAQQNTALLGRLQGGGQTNRGQASPITRASTMAGTTRTNTPTSSTINQPTNPISLIQKYFPQSQWENAYAVMMGESGGRNIPSGFNVRGTEDSHGLFQINLNAHPQMKNKVYNPEENVKFAAQLWEKSGWRPWGAYTNGKYKKYLSEAKNVMAQTYVPQPTPTPQPQKEKSWWERIFGEKEMVSPQSQRLSTISPQARTATPQGTRGEPIYDEMGRIVGFGEGRFSRPADFTDQALSRRMAEIGRFKPPLEAQVPFSKELMGASLQVPSPEAQESPEEEDIQNQLIDYYIRQQRKAGRY